jgi:uroporphyrinogen-III decarboxylase
MVEDEHCEFDKDALEKARAHEREVAQNGLVACWHGTSPLMDWVQHLAGLENGTYLLYDHRERVEALFEAMHNALLRNLEILSEHVPADAIYSGENTSTTLISPEMFRRYAQRHLTDYGRIIESCGKLHILHMCGKLKELLPDIAKVPAAAIEAFTSPSVGSTTLLDGRKACPEFCFIGGTNATLWLEPAEVIIETIGRDLDALPHTRGIVVTSAGVMPPLCPPERIKAVADWVKAYPVRT